MASADICSSATTPRVYASTTQSICASRQHAAVPLGPDDVDRRERSPSSTAAIPDAAAGSPSGGSPSPAQKIVAVGVHHHDPGRTGQPPGDRLGRGRPSSAPPPAPRSRRSSSSPADRSQYAVQTCCAAGQVRVHEDGAPAPPAASRSGTTGTGVSPVTASRSADAEGVRQQLGHPQRAGSATRSGTPGRRAPRAAAGTGRTASAARRWRRRRTARPAGRRRWRAARRPPRTRRRASRRTTAFSTLQPTTTRPSSTSAAAPTGNVEYGA